MLNIDFNLITSLSVVALSLSVLYVLIYSCAKKNKSFFVKLINYVILIVSFYFLVSMFQKTSDIIKIDVINTIENTEKYNGFYNPFVIVGTGTVGIIIGFVWYKMEKYVKERNIEATKKEEDNSDIFKR